MRAARALAAAVAVVALGASVPAGAQEDEAPPAPTPRLATPILSARRVPDLLVSQVAAEKVAVAADEVMDLAPATSCLVVHDGGQPVYARNGDTPLAPASNQKLLTSAALLAELGPDHVSTTSARAAAGPTDGVIDGDLYVVGGGDPLLLTDGYRPTQTNADERVTTDYGELADALVAAGVEEVRGDVVGDDGRYDDQRYVPSWPDRYQRQDTVGPLSALSVNDGVAGLLPGFAGVDRGG